MHITKKRDLCYTIAALAFANFLLFLTISQLIGGSAPNGMVRNGHYFLGEHGRYVEVSAPIYRYSQIHTYSLVLTTVAGLWAFKRGRELHEELEDYNPIISRNL